MKTLVIMCNAQQLLSVRPKVTGKPKKEQRGPDIGPKDDIVTFVQEESDPVDDETEVDEDNNNNESSEGPSNANAFSALETAMKWCEQQSECCPTQPLLLKRIRDLKAKKGRCTIVQRKISDYFPQKRVFSAYDQASFRLPGRKSNWRLKDEV
ncbi:uncharacterized protein TNCV_4444131 [Trichonephila clavipes]|nr:uncharacterized protein TNCV_4444131 [Trichonephila clavipes]